jgi:hypothetical protein
MKKHVVTLVALAFAGLALGSGGLAAADASGGSGKSYVPPAKTIVEVTGDKQNGFSIYHYDGSADYPPTDSESRAECSEYDSQVARVRCRTEVRVWYAALADLRRSINYQQSLLKD